MSAITPTGSNQLQQLTTARAYKIPDAAIKQS